MPNAMSQPGWFRASIERSEKLCREVLSVRWANPMPTYPDSLIKSVRHLSYFEQWKTYINGGHYDIQLSDGSLFQFKHQPRDKTILSYVFYESPLVGMLSYEEFVKDFFGTDLDEEAAAMSDYEVYLEQCEQRAHVTPARYDYSPSLYREGVHPAAHIHFGYESEIRVSCRRQMRPFSFVLFVLRQFYPVFWEAKFHTHKDASVLAKQVRDELELVDPKMFKNKDYWEVFLE